MSIKTINSSTIHDAGSKPPRRRVIPGVEPVVIKESWRPQVKFVNAAGHVVHVAVSGGSALVNDPAYRQRAIALQERNGGIIYGACPLRTGSIAAAEFPPELRDQMCDMRGPMNPKGEFGEHKGCPHVEHVIAVRQAKTRELAEQRERMFQSEKDIKAKRDSELIDALKEAVGQVATVRDHAKGKRGRPRKDRDHDAE